MKSRSKRNVSMLRRSSFLFLVLMLVSSASAYYSEDYDALTVAENPYEDFKKGETVNNIYEISATQSNSPSNSYRIERTGSGDATAVALPFGDTVNKVNVETYINANNDGMRVALTNYDGLTITAGVAFDNAIFFLFQQGDLNILKYESGSSALCDAVGSVGVSSGAFYDLEIDMGNETYTYNGVERSIDGACITGFESTYDAVSFGTQSFSGTSFASLIYLDDLVVNGGSLNGTGTTTPGTEFAEDSIFGRGQDGIIDLFGIDSDAANWFMGIMIVLFLTAFMYRITNSAAVGMIGGIMGVGFSVVLGFLPVYLLLIVGMIIILAMAKRAGEE